MMKSWEDLFQNTKEEDEEDKYVSGWGALFEETREDPVGTSRQTLMEASERGVALPERTWFDRVTAPFEAPQQFAFSLVKGIAEDGFQMSDLTDAAKHAAKFFLPWSEQPRIGADEVADIFFGEGTSQEGWKGFAATLGISLLFDPLLVPGAVGKLGAGSRAVKTLNRIFNPASMVFEAAGTGGKIAGRGLAKASEALLGPERYSEVSGALKHWLLPPSKAHPEEYNRLLVSQQLDVQEFRIRLGGVIKTAEEASPGTSEILVEAFTNRELNKALRAGSEGSKKAQDVAGKFFNRMEAAGVDTEIAYKLFEDWTEVATDLERLMLKHGVLDPVAAREMAFRHLRHSYTELQSPVDSLRRVNQIIDKMASGDARYAGLDKSTVKFGEVELRTVLEKFADDIMDVRSGRGGAVAAEFQQARLVRGENAQRYFKEVRSKGGVRTRRFDVDNFADDLHTYMQRNPNASIDDVFRHIDKEMLNVSGLPESFKASLGNYLGKGSYDPATGMYKAGRGAFIEEMNIFQVREALTVGKPSSEMTFQSYSVAFKKLQERKAIPQVLMDEVFGFQHSAVPRMVDHITEVAQEASLGKLLDDISGARRIGTEDYRWAKQQLAAAAREAQAATSLNINKIQDSREFKKAFDVVSEGLSARLGVSKDSARDILRKIDSGDIGEFGVFEKGLGGLATKVPTELNTRKLSGSEAAWGSLADMYVPETVYRSLRHAVKAAEELGSVTPQGIWQKMGDMVEGATGFFKFMKIAGDAGAHARDFVGSLIQMSVYGLLKFNRSALRDAAQLVKNVKAGQIDDYLQLAHDVGFDLLGGTFSSAELARRGSKVSRDSSRVLKLDDWLDNVTDMFDKVSDFAGDARNWASGVYQTREQTLRAYSFISRYEDIIAGVTKAGKPITRDVQLRAAKQAASTVEAALFNYADVSTVTEFARRYGIAPFITFPTKAAGQMVDLLYNTPHQVLKYHRSMNDWNSHWAGGDLAYAQEIQALPDHVRRNMVVRVPWETEDGNPMYLDLSYFIPWSSVRDLTRDIGRLGDPLAGLAVDPTDEVSPETQRFGGSYPGATGGSIFSPVIGELLRPFVTGKDGLGRDIYKSGDTTWDKAKALGRELYQFMLPPTFPLGGSTSDSVGRALLAAASEENEPRNWVEYLGLAMRLGKDDDVFNRYGEGPTSRALPQTDTSLAGKALLGGLSAFLPVTEANQTRSERNAGLALRSARNETAGKAREIMANPNLSKRNKEIRIKRLMDALEREAAEYSDWRNFFRQ